jgi:demethylmenaquinone methyltransferase/2-methoxy-6-polyprenyl-1,4-benzoquinol methylase
MLATESKLPVEGGPAKRRYIRGIFAAIAPSYDRVNRIISLNLDQYWRREGVRGLGWERVPAGTYLDLCAGTLDFGAELARQPGFRGRVVGADFVPEMLRLGRRKAPALQPVTADALDLPFADASFEGATVGWGMRNLTDFDAGLRELARVLKRGARLVIVEAGIPKWQPFRGLFLFYFDKILPAIGAFLSRHSTAYRWLPESTRVFPAPEVVAERMAQAGFREVAVTSFLGGVTTRHVGTRA